MRTCIDMILKKTQYYFFFLYVGQSRDSRSQCRAIAAQGPLPSTVIHFLQMIMENEVEIVVMLTKLQEENSEGKSV